VIDVEDFLRKNDIEFTIHDHPPVYTTDDLAKYQADFKGLACKNLLLKDQKGKRFFLIILPASEKVDISKTAVMVGEKKLSFANPENLRQVLGVEPGSVSPFSLLNDNENMVEVFISRKVLEAEYVSFHPNRNTASLELEREMFGKYLNKLNHSIHSFG